jgi:hypothetical protein
LFQVTNVWMFIDFFFAVAFRGFSKKLPHTCLIQLRLSRPHPDPLLPKRDFPCTALLCTIRFHYSSLLPQCLGLVMPRHEASEGDVVSKDCKRLHWLHSFPKTQCSDPSCVGMTSEKQPFSDLVETVREKLWKWAFVRRGPLREERVGVRRPTGTVRDGSLERLNFQPSMPRAFSATKASPEQRPVRGTDWPAGCRSSRWDCDRMRCC